MAACWKLEIDSSSRQEGFHSFLGGKPVLPVGQEIPECVLCGASQTFMFQVAFPIGHPWGGHSLAVFACTSCAQEGYFIPKMLDCALRGADIPKAFLESYQRNFKFIAFRTEEGVIRSNYVEKVDCQLLMLKACDDPNFKGTKIGGCPNWLLDDETPATYDTTCRMVFLMQLEQGMKFKLKAGAPHQIELSLNRKPVSSPFDYYQLFLGNALFLFGTEQPENGLVYAITQV
jgi:hypothetical protein